jgi:hypothetical protein
MLVRDERLKVVAGIVVEIEMLDIVSVVVLWVSVLESVVEDGVALEVSVVLVSV